MEDSAKAWLATSMMLVLNSEKKYCRMAELALAGDLVPAMEVVEGFASELEEALTPSPNETNPVSQMLGKESVRCWLMITWLTIEYASTYPEVQRAELEKAYEAWCHVHNSPLMQQARDEYLPEDLRPLCQQLEKSFA